MPRVPLSKHRVRSALVACAVVLGAFLDVSARSAALEGRIRAVETATVAQYLVLAGVSVFAAQWTSIFVVNVAGGALHVLATRVAKERLLTARVVAVVCSRQLGYLQALFPWVVLPVAFPLPSFFPEWTIRIGILAIVFAFGARIVDLAMRVRSPPPDDALATWRAQIVRQLYFFGFSVIGFLGLFLLAPGQAGALLPLLGAFTAGVPFRLVELGDARTHQTARDVWRRALASGRRYDVAFVVASQIVIAVVLWLKLHPAYVEEHRDVAARIESSRAVPASDAPAPGPKDAPIRLFLVADNHFHELSGERTGVHLDLADAIVRVAVRPVELDLLSGFTLARLARARADLERRRGAALPWAHLGDDADLGCVSELDRIETYASLFGVTPVALVPGNHESAFVGNFAWHPSWDPACGRSPRATKTTSDAILRASSPASQPVRHVSTRPALAAVQPLGRLGDADVVGVFVDTTDSSSIAIAGAQGAVSPAQAAFVRAELARWKEPWVVLFMHHPYDELTVDSQRSLAKMVQAAPERALALVSAHTHVAALRSISLGGVETPEFIVGSTTDPPQEAALLEIGLGERGEVALRVVTLPAIARPGATCGEDVTLTVPAATCDAVFERAKTACDEVFRARGLAVEGSHPRSPADVKAAQEVRARALLACLDRLDVLPARFAADVPAPLDDASLVPKLDALAKRLVQEPGDDAKKRLDELACFSWAGAALQRHKFEPGWSYARALEVATRPDTVFAAAEMTYDRATRAGKQRACTR